MDDAERLFAWRNDPDSRANSRNEDEIRWSDHLQWLRRVLAGDSVLLYVAEESGVALGTCRVDADGELSWTVAPEHRGKGHGKEMVRLVAEAANCPLMAEIKSSNLASLRIVGELGFEKVADGEMTRWIRKAPQTK